MTFAINLRFDLKRLDDERLAAAFETTIGRREALPQSSGTWWNPYPFRALVTPGLIRHRAAYRANVYLGAAFDTDIAFTVVLLGLLGIPRFRRWVLDSTPAEAYLLECELFDLMDEMMRRVVRRGET